MARTPRKERISRYPFEVVVQHIRKNLPEYPDFTVNYITSEIASCETAGSAEGRCDDEGVGDVSP